MNESFFHGGVDFAGCRFRVCPNLANPHTLGLANRLGLMSGVKIFVLNGPRSPSPSCVISRPPCHLEVRVRVWPIATRLCSHASRYPNIYTTTSDLGPMKLLQIYMLFKKIEQHPVSQARPPQTRRPTRGKLQNNQQVPAPPLRSHAMIPPIHEGEQPTSRLSRADASIY